MNPGAIHIDTRQFKAALGDYYKTTQKELQDVLNQRAFNIAGRTIDAMKPAPGAEQSTRGKIRGYMNEQVSTRIRLAKSGKRKGNFLRKGSRANQLVRANLILQARRRKMGMPGLYGAGMAAAEGRFKLAAQVGVGFLKSAFLPIIKGLHPLVKFKRVRTSWGRISVWPGSDGYGKVNPAKKSWNPSVTMTLRWIVSGAPTKVQRLVVPHLQAAFDAEAREMTRHVTEKLQAAANKVNAR